MFNFNDAVEENKKPEVSYIKSPGIYENVKAVKTSIEETSKNNVPYLKITFETSTGDLGFSNKMFLGNDKEKAEREGKKATGFQVTARNIINLVKATNNVDDETAKGMLGDPASHEELAQQVAALIVGKAFRAKFRGERDAKGRVWPYWAESESMRVEKDNSKLRYNEQYDIRNQQGVTVVEGTEAINSPEGNDDLPF
jgi:hypothetical protein